MNLPDKEESQINLRTEEESHNNHKCCPATVAVEKLVPFPERECKRVKVLEPRSTEHGAFDMNTLALVSKSIAESPFLTFPLIEWSTNENETDVCLLGEEELLMESPNPLSMSSASHSVYTFIDKFLADGGIAGRRGRSNSDPPPPSFLVRERQSFLDNKYKGHCHGSGVSRRLVRSIALESQLELLDSSAPRR